MSIFPFPGLSALGRDYEDKKQKLLLELQLEYKDYVTKVCSFSFIIKQAFK